MHHNVEILRDQTELLGSAVMEPTLLQVLLAVVVVTTVAVVVALVVIQLLAVVDQVGFQAHS